MSHACEDCGETFETLTTLRLHDCPASDAGEGDPGSERGDERLASLVDDATDGDVGALEQALAEFETTQAAAREAGDTDRYRAVSRTHREPLVGGLDAAVRESGWSVLDEFVAAYRPETAAELPHVTPILQNVTGRYLVRTRLADGVDAIPAAALGYFDAIRDEVGAAEDFVREGLHPYGWGIGHPEHDVADAIHALAGDDVFLANAMLEHAFYADQHAAVELLERIAADDSIQGTVPYGTGEITLVRALLDAPAGAASENFWPNIPRYWDWYGELAFDFKLDSDVKRRMRTLVTREGLDADLPRDWAIADLTL
jgi:hypothetical protein